MAIFFYTTSSAYSEGSIGSQKAKRELKYLYGGRYDGRQKASGFQGNIGKLVPSISSAQILGTRMPKALI